MRIENGESKCMKVRDGFVESEGHRLAYLAVNEHLENQSDQPAIVFIHGVLATVNFWLDCVPPSFKEGRAWFSLSLPAHHPSTVPDDFAPEHVNDTWFFRVMNGALAKLLGHKKAIVVGHSTGGFSALNLAIHQSPYVLGIISVAGFHRGNWGGVEGQLVKLAGLGNWAMPLFVANLWLAKRIRFIQRMFASFLAKDRKAYRSNPQSRRMLDNVRPNVVQQDSAALFKLFHGIGSLEIIEQLSAIHIPTYIFAGAHDPVVPARQSLALIAEIAQAKTVVFKDVGHMPFIEDSETYFDALERALSELGCRANLES